MKIVLKIEEKNTKKEVTYHFECLEKTTYKKMRKCLVDFVKEKMPDYEVVEVNEVEKFDDEI